MKAQQVGNKLVLTWEKDDEIKVGEKITIELYNKLMLGIDKWLDGLMGETLYQGKKTEFTATHIKDKIRNEWGNKIDKLKEMHKVNRDATLVGTYAKSMDIKNKITAVMVDTHRSIIGEDGLTVWDFAELRDSLTELFTLQEDSFRRKVEWLIGEDEETQHGPQRWVDAKAAIRNKFRAELRAKLKELK